jgi:hypothetical protein
MEMIMNPQTKLGWLLVLALLLPLRAEAGDDFVWEPITAADWKVAEDTTKGIRDAVILFEKMIADDGKLLDKKCYLTVYRRIKIFNAEGRKWGDVNAPYIHKKQKIEAIRGRTVLPDGQEIPLLETQIFEKEVLKAGGVKIKQKSFSLPGISDGCIVEYFIKYRLPAPNSAWHFQNEIVLLQGEYRWLFYRGQGLPTGIFKILVGELAPNYLWLNTARKYKEEHRPSIKDPREVVFLVDNVPAFAKEPHALPEVSLQAQLRCYYGSATTPAAYWGEVAKGITTTLEEYTQSNKRVREAIASFGAPGTEEAKIKAAYDWLQSNLKNTSYLDSDEELKDNKTADETIKHGYGTQEDINYIFYDMLREMNIDAKMAFVVDRDENLFAQDAKYWQFDRSLVAVPDGRGNYRFYSPGDLHLPSTHVPWFNEGIRAFLVGDVNQQFVVVPFSSAASNRTRRMFTLELEDDSKLEGKLAEQRFGHHARAIQLLLAQNTEAERQEKLKNELTPILPNTRIDSIAAIENKAPKAPVTLECNLQVSGIEQRLGSRLLLQPFGFLKQSANPFHAGKRQYPIMFDHAYELADLMKIDLPDNWKVEALPADTTFENEAGYCEAHFQAYENTLSVQRLFRLNRPFWIAKDYPVVQELFQAKQVLDAMTVVLEKNETQATER